MCQALFTPQNGGKGWREKNKIKKEGKGKLKVEGTKQPKMIQSFALSLVYLIGVNLTPILSNVFQSNSLLTSDLASFPCKCLPPGQTFCRLFHMWVTEVSLIFVILCFLRSFIYSETNPLSYV